jgi:peptidoglycan/LPS O-acetylase OafA/YrhL
MHPSSRPASLPSLTGLRFFAAAVVVWGHFAPGGIPYDAAGTDMVCLFFLLSGFILTYTARPAPGRARSFYVARLARIYPAYLLALGLALLRGHTQADLCPASPRAAAPFALVGMPSWLPSATWCVNAPAWGVSCGVFFYLLFPLLLPLLLWQSTQRVWLVLVGCWLLRLVIVLAFVALPPRINGSFVLSVPLSRLPDFVLGISRRQGPAPPPRTPGTNRDWLASSETAQRAAAGYRSRGQGAPVESS